MIKDEINNHEFLSDLKYGAHVAFQKLYETFSHRLWNLAYKMTGNKDDAEDTAQEIFIQALKNISSFRGDSSIYTWLYTIGKNIFLRHLQTSSRSSFVELQKIMHYVLNDVTDNIQYIPMKIFN